MAQPVSCDICEAEPGAQMMTNLETGGTIAVGAACLPLFYAQSTLTLMDAGEHKGLPQRCQACRRIHERVTLAARPGQPTDDVEPGNVKDQPLQQGSGAVGEHEGDTEFIPDGNGGQAAGSET